VSGTIRDLAEAGWSGAVPAGQLWKPTGRAEEIVPGVIFLHTFANMTVVRTSAGLVLIDTSNYAARARTFALVRSVSDAPVFAAIYTHGHADHALGLPPFLAQAREQGWPRPYIIGHRNVAARFARYRQTNGYNALINARQFGIAPTWPMDYDDPDVAYDDVMGFTPGEIDRSSCITRAARPTTTPGCGGTSAGFSGPAISSSGSRPTPATRRRFSATPATGRCPCAPCVRSSPSC